MPNELTQTWTWLSPLLVFAGVLALGLLLRILLMRALARWARSTSTRFDDVVLASVRWPSVLWVVLLAIIAAINSVDLPGEHADTVLRRGMSALLVLSITIGAARLAGGLVGGDYRADTDGGA